MVGTERRRRLAVIAAGLLAAWLPGCGPRPEDVAARAHAALEAGKPAEAAELLRSVDPLPPQAWPDLARACAALQLPGDEVLRLFLPAAESRDPRLVLLAARAAVAADRLGEALGWLEQAAERIVDSRELTIERAKLLGRLGRPREAVVLLRPLTGSDPRVLNLIGFSELLAGEPEAARAYLERAVREAESLGRPYAVAHYHLGRYFLGKGELAAAERELSRAVEINPGHLEASYLLLGVREKLGEDPQAAKEHFAGLYSRWLESQGAGEEPPAEAGGVDHGDDIVTRPIHEGPSFKQAFPAGSRIEVACHAPAGESARFVLTVSAGEGAGEPLLDAIFAGKRGRGEWIDCSVDLPGSRGESVLELEVRPVSLWDRLRLADPPEDAYFSEPRALAAVSGRSLDPRPNLLLISLDTLRADRLGAWGYARPTSPHLDRLAQEGIRFARAEAMNNWTLPSHMSIFSGLTPTAHGVMPDMSSVRGYLYPDRKLPVTAPSGLRMFTEVLEEAGYRTAAVTENGWVSAHFGFGRGFRVYRSDLRGNLPRTLSAALEQLEATAERGPWFLFVHTYTPHQPYHAPSRWRLRWARRDHVGMAWPSALVPIGDYYRFRAPAFPPSPSDIAAFGDLYDGQVAWADSLVGELEGWLGERGLNRQTVTVVTSDHGEEIFERGQFDHGDTLYEEVTHVPLIFHGPGLLPQGLVIDGPVSLGDLGATLLDLAGEGAEFGAGESLAPLWSASGGGSQRRAFAEARDFSGATLASVWSGRYKLLRRSAGPSAREWLFDLEADPREQKDLLASRQGEAGRLGRLLDEHLSTAAKLRELIGSGEGELDEEMIERLRSLGYAR